MDKHVINPSTQPQYQLNISPRNSRQFSLLGRLGLITPTADVAVGKECQDFDGATGDEFYKITVTNAGPGSSRQVKDRGHFTRRCNL